VEAAAVLTVSPKASAALSRRCLQRLLREVAQVTPGDLAGEIQAVIDSRKLPSDLADDIDAIRAVGNIAAHPIKSKTTGVIVDVEPGEAELTIQVLEELFDWYFVRPVRRAEQRSAINQKLQEAGKPLLKQGSPRRGGP
jgi:hypothetical protein